MGGKPGPISIYTRNTSSGTYSDFKGMAMSKKDYAGTAQKMAGNEQIAAEVGKNPNGVGYVGMAYLNAAGRKGRRGQRRQAFHRHGAEPLLSDLALDLLLHQRHAGRRGEVASSTSPSAPPGRRS